MNQIDKKRFYPFSSENKDYLPSLQKMKHNNYREHFFTKMNQSSSTINTFKIQ